MVALSAISPGPDAHPTEVFGFGAVLLMVLGYSTPGSTDPWQRPGKAWITEEARRLGAVLREEVCVRRLSVDRTRVLAAEWTQRLADAARVLEIVPGPRRCRQRRLDALSSRGIQLCGHLVVRSELDAIVAADEALAASWHQQDEAERERQRDLAAKRSASRARRKARLAEREARWRQQWAVALGVPVDILPRGLGNPTRAAVRTVSSQAPAWLRSARKAPGGPDLA